MRSKSVCAGTHYIKFLGWIIFKLPCTTGCGYYTIKYKHPLFAVSEESEGPKITLLSKSFSSAIQAITYADVIARYRSCPAVSHIWAFIVFPSTWMLLVANSTPMVLLLSKLNSLRVNRDRRLLLPTPESPISTTTRQKWHKNQIPDVDNALTITCNKHFFSGMKHEGMNGKTTTPELPHSPAFWTDLRLDFYLLHVSLLCPTWKNIPPPGGIYMAVTAKVGDSLDFTSL